MAQGPNYSIIPGGSSASGGGGGTVTQGTAAPLSGAWPVIVTDGTNAGAVAAANTMPAGTAPAQVTIGRAAGGANLTSLNMGTTSFTALASNPNRVSYVMINNSNNTCYIAFAATASAALHTYEIIGGAILEPPPGQFYTGVISALSAGATGTLLITEIVA